jgi:ADP-ribose pyrophosphatase YjhB (NUDIX family)
LDKTQTTTNNGCPKLIPLHLYNKIVDYLPIVSVEAIITNEDSLLFLKRNNPPAKGLWWFPGGRIRKGENFEEALCREVKEETGLEVVESKFINVYSRVFNERHDITIAYLCKCKGNTVLNDEHSEYKYFKQPPKTVHPYLTQVITDLKSQS